MNQLDVLYRALNEYKKQSEDDRDCKRERKAIVSSNPESDKIITVKTICTIEEDWIIEIEKGLVHIEKAINEARQHILTQGEVVPIETVKRVSKDSVKHLAKHSDFITREQQNNDLIPDKLYIVERTSDFAVYENRFLYMLLCYLKNFISSKYSKILELTNTFFCSITINKSVVMDKRKTVFELKMSDEKRDDPYLKKNNPLQPILDRIDNILKTVMHFLSTPLIQEVSKATPLKPPITKTNVLKMNLNFKGAVSLYDFVTAYDKKGYSVEKLEEQINPLPDDAAAEFSDVVMLTSFLTYKYGLGIKKALKDSFEMEEDRRREEEKKQHAEQLLQLKSRIDDSESDLMEYMLLLEKRNKILELDSLQLAQAKHEIQKLQVEAIELKNNNESLNSVIDKQQEEINLVNQKLVEETTRLKEEHQRQVIAITERHNVEKNELIEAQKQEIIALNIEHNHVIDDLVKAHKDETEAKDNRIITLEENLKQEQALHKQRLQETESAFISKIEEMEAVYSAEVSKLNELNESKSLENASLLNAKLLSDSRINSLRKEYKLIAEDEDFTAKVTFDELEHQYKVFKAFFKDEWKKTKRNIRKDILIARTQNGKDADKNI